MSLIKKNSAHERHCRHAHWPNMPNAQILSCTRAKAALKVERGRGMGMDDMDEELELKCEGDKRGDKKETAHIRQAKVELVAE